MQSKEQVPIRIIIVDNRIGRLELSPKGGGSMTTFQALTLMISFSTMVIALIAVVVAIFNATKK